MANLEKRAFPQSLGLAEGEVQLEAFSAANVAELWECILSDRQSPWRKDIWPGTNSLEDLTKYMLTCDVNNPDSGEFTYLIRNNNRKLVGTFHVHTVSWWNKRTELGYWVHHFYEGAGYATQALKNIELMLRSFGFHRLEICCDPANEKSCALALRNGYVKEGVLREESWTGTTFRDTAIFSKLLI
jgi:ribosomal-protein-serine acetyltransferase